MTDILKRVRNTWFGAAALALIAAEAGAEGDDGWSRRYDTDSLTNTKSERMRTKRVGRWTVKCFTGSSCAAESPAGRIENGTSPGSIRLSIRCTGSNVRIQAVGEDFPDHRTSYERWRDQSGTVRPEYSLEGRTGVRMIGNREGDVLEVPTTAAMHMHRLGRLVMNLGTDRYGNEEREAAAEAELLRLIRRNDSVRTQFSVLWLRWPDPNRGTDPVVVFDLTGSTKAIDLARSQPECNSRVQIESGGTGNT